MRTFKAYLLAESEPVSRSHYLPKVYRVYGGVPYFSPDGWWQVRVEPFCSHGYQRMKSDFDEVKDWPIAYHGTPCESLASILASGLRKQGELDGVFRRHGGCGAGPNGSIYLSPSLWYSSHPVYSTMKQVGQEVWAQAVLKVRVRPKSYRMQGATLFERHWSKELSFDPNLPGDAGMEWLLDGSSVRRTDCVIVGIMLRLVGSAASRQLFGPCPPLSADEQQKPEYAWTAHLQRQFRLGGFVRDNTLEPVYVLQGADEGAGDDETNEEEDGLLRDPRGVSTAEAASRSAEQLEALGLSAIVEKLLAEFGASWLSGGWAVPLRLDKGLLERVRWSMTRGEPVRDSDDARSRYRTLLDRLAKHAEGGAPLDSATLLAWHGLYMKGIHPSSGQLRERGVTCGEYPYMPPSKLAAAFDEYAQEATRVAARSDLCGPTKAAWCHYHMVRLHPFADGNGRMGRLMAIWALARHGLPWKLCLVPLFEEDTAGRDLDISRRAYFEAHLIAARQRGAQSADVRPFAVHVCRCIVSALRRCGGLPPGIKLEVVRDSLKTAEAAAVASSVRPTAEHLARDWDSAYSSEVPREARLTSRQWSLVRQFAAEAAVLDPAGCGGAREQDWSHLVRVMTVRLLRSSHSTVSATFSHGPHAGESVAGLTELLRAGYSPLRLPPLLAVEWRGSHWVIAGNRRLRAVMDFSLDASVRVVVHALGRDAALLAKFVMALTTRSGAQAPGIAEEDCVSESSTEESSSTTLESDTSTQ